MTREELDANMAKFVLTNDYGKQDKQVVEQSVQGLSERDLDMIRRVEERLARSEGDDGRRG